MIRYRDQRLYTRHKDGTMMLTSSDGKEIIVQKERHASIKIRLDPDQANAVVEKGSEFVGVDDVMKRSNDGRVVETYLPDGTLVETFKEAQQTPEGEGVFIDFVHLIRRADGGVIKVSSSGEVVIITPNERAAIKEESKEFGKDTNYFRELFSSFEDRKSGVYTILCDQGMLCTIDDEKNEFYVFASGESKEKMTPLPEPIIEVVKEEIKEEVVKEPPKSKEQKKTAKDNIIKEPIPQEPVKQEPKFIPLPKYYVV